jgi:uncharacterized membrane protein YsdA (DUF1294 family)
MIETNMTGITSIVLVYLIIIWMSTLLLFRIDKKRAQQKNAPRISERRLLQLAIIGGWPAALLARRLFRHKTTKQPFSTLLCTIAGVETVLLFAVAAHVLNQ